MAARPTTKSASDGSAIRNLWAFLTDTPEQKAARLAIKEARTSGAPVSDPASDTQFDATPTESGTKLPRVSRRARLLGGHRGRAVVLGWAAIAVVGLTVFNTAMVLSKPGQDEIDAAVAAALREEGVSFPAGQAVAWADQAVVDWGTWDEANRDAREVRIAPYLTRGMDSQAGWNGQGTQTVTFTSTNPDPTVIDENHALVDVDYRLSDSSRRCVTVPVYAYLPEGLTGTNIQWAFALSGNPIPRPCAPRTGAVTAPSQVEAQKDLSSNEELNRELTSTFFPGFFAAWAASDANSLRQYTASGVTTIGLGGAMSATPAPGIADVVIMTPKDGTIVDGAIYTATVPVTWTVAGSTAQITATYDVPMKLIGDRWYVAGEPTPSVTSSGATTGDPESPITPDADTTGATGTPSETPGT